MIVYSGPRLESAAPSTKANLPGYEHYRVLGTEGVGSGQMEEDRRAGHRGKQQEWDDGSHWVSGTGRKAVDWDGWRSGAGGTGGRKYLG